MANTELTLGNLQDTIRDRVRTVLIDAIPPELIQRHIQQEFDNFFKAPNKPSYHSGPDPISPFQAMVQAEIAAVLKPLVTQAITTTSNEMRWGSHEKGPEYVKRIVQELSPILLEGMMVGIARNAVENIQHAANRNF